MDVPICWVREWLHPPSLNPSVNIWFRWASTFTPQRTLWVLDILSAKCWRSFCLSIHVFQGSCPTCRETRVALSLPLLSPHTPHLGAHCILWWDPTPRVALQALMDLKDPSMDTKVGTGLPKLILQQTCFHWCNFHSDVFWKIGPLIIHKLKLILKALAFIMIHWGLVT